uniref:cDNA FLJ59053 n=1 Tax=Homo sapiens TaxID=9606 RepID=B7Z6Z8_HUMAN|nr:unnamed protein product [Homo sapiens]
MQSEKPQGLFLQLNPNASSTETQLLVPALESRDTLPPTHCFMAGTESPLGNPWPLSLPPPCWTGCLLPAPRGQRKPGPLGLSIFISLGNKRHRSGNHVVRESEQPLSQGNPHQGWGPDTRKGR